MMSDQVGIAITHLRRPTVLILMLAEVSFDGAFAGSASD